MAKKATRGNNAQFTYDFGIAIAQSTVNKITRLTGVSLTLASAFYALKTTASDYVKLLRENTLRFGGVLSTMKAMEQAQDRLIKGQSYFTMDDQLRGMNRLLSVGIKVGDNLEWINKAAHATGMGYSEFSGMIASAIQGNSQALVDAGLMTQRATRMFDKYAANTVMRQQAILNFVKTHKGLMSAIKNDFETVQDQITRIKGTWRAFLQSVVGSPKDPNSFYGQIVASMKMVAVALSRNAETLKKYGFIIGQTLGWVIRQIGHFVVWIGRQTKKAIQSVWKVTDDFQNQTRSMLVWLEFWKLKVVDFFKEYGGAIKTILKLLIAYKLMKAVFVVSKAAIASVVALKNAWASALLLQKKYLNYMGPVVGNRFTRWLQSLAAFMPRTLRRIWVSVGKFIENLFFGGVIKRIFTSLFGLKPLFRFLGNAVKFLFGLLKNIPAIFMAILKAGKALITALFVSNPVGWIILAVTLLGTLYVKCEKFRAAVNGLFKVIFESLKLVWNFTMFLLTAVMIGFKKIWGAFKTYVWTPLKRFFAWAWDGVKTLWDSFKDSSVGRWIEKWIVNPLKSAFEWILTAWNKVIGGIGKALTWLGLANDNVKETTENLADKYGVPTLPTFGGGNYEPNDTTNYLNPFRNSGAPTESTTPNNPLLDTPPTLAESKTVESTTSMTFSNGAIQIVVNKGEGIDEDKLARKVKEVLADLGRGNNIRGGIV